MSWTRRRASVRSLPQLKALTTFLILLLYFSIGKIGATQMLWETSRLYPKYLTGKNRDLSLLYYTLLPLTLYLVCLFLQLFQIVIMKIMKRMQWWRDTGLALHWIKSYQPSAKGCLLQDYKKNAPAIRVLTLRDLSSAFVLLLLGLSLSLLVFLAEKIFYKISTIRRGWIWLWSVLLWKSQEKRDCRLYQDHYKFGV